MEPALLHHAGEMSRGLKATTECNVLDGQRRRTQQMDAGIQTPVPQVADGRHAQMAPEGGDEIIGVQTADLGQSFEGPSLVIRFVQCFFDGENSGGNVCWSRVRLGAPQILGKNRSAEGITGVTRVSRVSGHPVCIRLDQDQRMLEQWGEVSCRHENGWCRLQRLPFGILESVTRKIAPGCPSAPVVGHENLEPVSIRLEGHSRRLNVAPLTVRDEGDRSFQNQGNLNPGLSEQRYVLLTGRVTGVELKGVALREEVQAIPLAGLK